MDEAMVLARALSGGAAADRAWEPFRDGIEVSWLYRNGDHGPAAAFLRYAPGARVPLHLHAGYEHVLILQGSQTDRTGRQGTGTLVVNRPGTRHDVVSEDGCLVLVIWERPVIIEEPPAR
jgi:anti-sigma factor ChrR (cupin superfamily)